MGQSEILVQFDCLGKVRRRGIVPLPAPFPEVRRTAEVMIIRIKAGGRLSECTLFLLKLHSRD